MIFRGMCSLGNVVGLTRSRKSANHRAEFLLAAPQLRLHLHGTCASSVLRHPFIKYNLSYALITLSLDSAPSISRRLFRLSRLITSCWKVIDVVAGADLRLACVQEATLSY